MSTEGRVHTLIQQSLIEAVDESRPVIDVFMFRVQFKADASKDEFLSVLREVTQPRAGVFNDVSPERLQDGPSYIEMGGWLGDQQRALIFMALGEHHGVWQVVTPMTLGFDRGDDEAKRMAGMGMVMIAGFDPAVLT